MNLREFLVMLAAVEIAALALVVILAVIGTVVVQVGRWL